MSWTEVLTSLAQGTIDGQENPVAILTANNIWEIQKYATLTGACLFARRLRDVESALGRFDRGAAGWFKEAGKAGAAATRATVSATETAGIQMMRDNGMEVVENIDKAAFAAAVQPAYTEYAEQMGVADLIAEIQAAQE